MGAIKKGKLVRDTSGSSQASKRAVASERGGKVKKNYAPRKFRPIWLHVKAFKKWLILDYKKPYMVYCKICKQSLVARYQRLVYHAKTKDHLSKSGFKMPTDEDFRIPLKKEIKQERMKARAELKLAGLCADINQPFRNICKVVNAFKSISKESTVQNLRVGRTKARDLVTNVIGKCAKSSLDDLLRNNRFSICVDESTDTSKDKSLAIVVRYTDFNLKRIQSKLWAMIPVFQEGKEAKAGADRLFRCINNSFAECNIPLDNIVGCCFDGCQTMIGEKSGLKKRLEDAIPGIVCVQCPAHSTHLCAQHAIKRLPAEIVSFLTMVHNMLNSAHKTHDFSEMQKEQLLVDLGFPQRKILKMSMTRWLVMENCTTRVLEQFPVIFDFAEKQSLKGDNAAKEVLAVMQKPDFKLYYLLLQQTLHELNSLNTLFQRQDIVLDVAREGIEKCYKNIVSVILQRDYVNRTPAQDIDVFDVKNYMRYIDFDVGSEIRDALIENGDCMGDFCKSTFNYVIALSLQMRERFHNFKHPVYNVTECLKISNALSDAYRLANPNAFADLMQLYAKLIATNKQRDIMQKQWDSLSCMKIADEVKCNLKIEEFWMFVLNFVNDEGAKPYAVLAEFVLDVLTTPHANADPERIFSDVNNCKTKNRNKMHVNTVEASVRARQLIRSQSDFEPTKDMIDMHLDAKYYTYRKPAKKNML